jgi:phospholipid-binding lipoprotein MlaA
MVKHQRQGLLLLIFIFISLLSFNYSVFAEDTTFHEKDYLDEETMVTVADPLEPWNRMVFQFNDRLYFWLIKPVARGYSMVMPEDFRYAISNFFHNITAPVRVINCLLQGKIKSAGIEAVSFVLNTTGGVFGLHDFAGKDLKLRVVDDEDLGQTLGIYGIGNGIYIVWPVLGPSTLRDTFGILGDGFLDPINYLELESAIMVHSIEFTNKTSLHLGEYEDMKASALDPYIAIQDAYIQYRNKKIKK